MKVFPFIITIIQKMKKKLNINWIKNNYNLKEQKQNLKKKRKEKDNEN